MKKGFVLFVLSLGVALVQACGSAPPPPPSTPNAADTCPLLDAGPPPVCPEGCVWNGTQCRPHQAIVIPYVVGRDGGHERP